MRVAILTVSDGCFRGEREDSSGALIEAWCRDCGHVVAERRVVPDATSAIVKALLPLCDGGRVDAVLTTGGTGFGPRDVTPEATRAVLDRVSTGLAEAVRRQGEKKTPFAVLSRGMAGVRGSCFIINLPGSPGGVTDALGVLRDILPHVIGLLTGEVTLHPAQGEGEE